MLAVLQVTTPIYLLIALGFGALRTGYLEPGSIRALGSFVIRICVPALVFTAVQGGGGEALNLRVVAAYAAGSLAVFGLGLVVMRFVRRSPLAPSAIAGLGVATSNSGFMGYPIASLVVGPETAAAVLACTMIVENILIIPLSLALADAGSFAEDRFPVAFWRAIKQLRRNPLMIGLVAGLAMNLAGIALPQVIAQFLGYVVSAAPVVALFVVGGTVASFPLRGVGPDAILISGCKLILHPLAVFAALEFFPGLSPETMLGAVLFASVPMLSIFPIFGQRYGIESLTAMTLVAATTLSFVTVSLLILFFG